MVIAPDSAIAVRASRRTSSAHSPLRCRSKVSKASRSPCTVFPGFTFSHAATSSLRTALMASASGSESRKRAVSFSSSGGTARL